MLFATFLLPVESNYSNCFLVNFADTSCAFFRSALGSSCLAGRWKGWPRHLSGCEWQGCTRTTRTTFNFLGGALCRGLAAVDLKLPRHFQLAMQIRHLDLPSEMWMWEVLLQFLVNFGAEILGNISFDTPVRMVQWCVLSLHWQLL